MVSLASMRYRTATFLFLLVCIPALHGTVLTVLGFEGPAREPQGNLHEAWIGLQFTADNQTHAIFHALEPYIKVLASARFGEDYLLSAGLALRLQPVRRLPELRICLQSGPSLSDVGKAHTGSHLNWTSDILLRYRALVIGYSHTSNGSIARPNSGLDLLLIGFAFKG